MARPFSVSVVDWLPNSPRNLSGACAAVPGVVEVELLENSGPAPLVKLLL